MVPSFIVAGAPKSGTTSLWEYLKAHPEVCMARMKEPAFFTEVMGWDETGDESAPRRSGRFRKGMDWYQGLFGDCESKKATGEASTLYWEATDAAGLIRRHVPDVRLIFLVRNPVNRVYSNYWQERKQGRKIPDFYEMVMNRHPRLEQYIYVSSYDIHLERFSSIFDDDQLLVLLYEDMRNNPAEVLRAVYGHIGIDESFLPSNLGQKFNAARLPRSDWTQRLISAPWLHRTADKLPDWARAVAVKSRTALVSLNSVQRQYPPLSSRTRESLSHELSGAVDAVEEFLGQAIPSWRS